MRKKDDRKKKTSRLILEMLMNGFGCPDFVSLTKKYEWLEIFPEFSLKINSYKGSGKNIIPNVNWLKTPSVQVCMHLQTF